MNGDLKRKLDDLNELLSQNYITDSEYASARENVLADAGIDIVPRMEGPIVRDSVRPLQPRRDPQPNSGCGCFLILLLLLVAAAGCFLALPEDIARNIPGVGQLYLKSINLFDYDVFMMDGVFYTFIGLLAGILVDISYGFIDPRIRMGER